MNLGASYSFFKPMEEELIELVRQHEVLYNTALRNYKDIRIRQEAWEEVAKELNTTASVAKAKWENLRRCFSNAHSRRIKKSGQAATTTPAWKFDQQMQFLLPYLEDRRTLSNLVNLSNKSNVAKEDTITEERCLLMDAPENVLLDDNVREPEENVEILTSHIDTSTRENNAAALENIKHSRKYGRTKNSSMEKLLSVMEKNASLRQKKYEEKVSTRKHQSCFDSIDDTDLYFLSLSKITKKLPKAEQVHVKKEVASIVFNAEFRSSQHQVCNSPEAASAPTPSETDVIYSPQISPIISTPAAEPVFLSEEYYASPNESDVVCVDAGVYQQ